MALAEKSTAITTATEENIAEVPMPAVIVATEPPDTFPAVVTGDNGKELVLQEVGSEVSQAESDDFSIVDKPAPIAGFVKRWTRKIFGWVKRMFKWRKD